MILKKIYSEAYLKKKEEIFRRYYEEKDQVLKGKLPVFQNMFQETINSEYTKLFYQNSDEKSEYHFIERFNSFMPGADRSYKTFDEDYFDTEKKIKGIYKDHSYGPKVSIFFEQNNEIIVMKLGHLKAYNELRTDFVEALKKYTKWRKKAGHINLFDRKEIEREFSKLFTDFGKMKNAVGTLKNYYLDKEGNFKKIKNLKWKPAFFVALYDVWFEFGYFENSLTENEAIIIIGAYFHFEINERPNRKRNTTNYNEAKENFMLKFVDYRADK